jgi:hypothetical protein
MMEGWFWPTLIFRSPANTAHLVVFVFAVLGPGLNWFPIHVVRANLRSRLKDALLETRSAERHSQTKPTPCQIEQLVCSGDLGHKIKRLPISRAEEDMLKGWSSREDLCMGALGHHLTRTISTLAPGGSRVPKRRICSVRACCAWRWKGFMWNGRTGFRQGVASKTPCQRLR